MDHQQNVHNNFILKSHFDKSYITVKPLILAALYFLGLIYYIFILVPLIWRFCLLH